MFTIRRVAHPQLSAALTAVRDISVRIQHEIAVPLLGDLHAIRAAVVLAEQRFRARQCFERRIDGFPRLLRTRNRRHPRLAHGARADRNGDGRRRNEDGNYQRTSSHVVSPVRLMPAATLCCRVRLDPARRIPLPAEYEPDAAPPSAAAAWPDLCFRFRWK